jgi:eukaryotic-like serine/threonine-protein kinase
MADVFLAERLGDDGFRTRVALKRLHRGLAMDSYFIRQLIREARLLGQLEHANIVRVFDLRRVGDEYYVVMEYVDGIDLAAVVKVHRSRKTRIPRPFFFHVGLSLAEALSYAHSAVDEEGNPTPLIHRDIKPSNVMLSRRGIVKLTDFGIAHVGDGSVTGGLVQGTANYMSPEQAFGEDRLLAASDVYSLGAVFYEMLTGRPLINGDNYLKAIHQVRERKVTLDELASLGVEPGLRMVIAKMLSADLAGRYAEMESVRNDLQFVADRLKIDLSWHRIRAYVGRLMGLLGRAPGRATLSGLTVPEEVVGNRLLQSDSPDLPTPLPSSPTPSPPTPVRRMAVEESEVTRAVAKDMLDAAVRALAEESAGAPDPVPAPRLPPSNVAAGGPGQSEPSGESTVVFPNDGGPVTGPRVPADTIPAPPPTGHSRPPVEAPQVMASQMPVPSAPDAWSDDTEQTRVFAGPSPSEAGVYGTDQARPAPAPAPPAGWAAESQQLQPLGALAEVGTASAHLGPPRRGVRSGEQRSYEEEQTLPPGTPAVGGVAASGYHAAQASPVPVPPLAPPAAAPRAPIAARPAAPAAPPLPGPAVAQGLPLGAVTSGHVEVIRRRAAPERRKKKKKRPPRRPPISPKVIGVLVTSVLFLLSVLFLYVYAVRFQAHVQPISAPPALERPDPQAPDPGILGRSVSVPTNAGPA